MTFVHSEYLYGLLSLPAILLFLVLVARRRRAAVSRLGDSILVERLCRSVNWRSRRWRTVLWFVGITLTIIALARPQWGSEVRVVEQKGVQLIVALDVSRSMLAEDVKPNRLSRAKLEINDLMSHLKGDEVGLVLFSGASFVLFPLTFDYATARTYLENADPDAISRPGTAIGDAIYTALGGFDEMRTSQKVIVIMTDGESHEGDPVEAARQAAEKNVIVYTVGFGTAQGEPIPEHDQRGEVVGYKKDQQGQTVLSKLDEITLQEIANVADGKYFRAGADGGAIDALASELDTLQKADIQSEFETRQVERFQVFSLVAVLALVLAELMADRVTSSPVRSISRSLSLGRWRP